MADAPKEPAKDFDVILPHSPTDDGQGVRVLRSRPGRLEAGEVRPVKEGAPIVSGELVRLTRREDHPELWDVHVQYAATGEGAHDGPARVSSEAYRQNWERIFGSHKEPGDDKSLN